MQNNAMNTIVDGKYAKYSNKMDLHKKTAWIYFGCGQTTPGLDLDYFYVHFPTPQLLYFYIVVFPIQNMETSRGNWDMEHAPDIL